MAVLGTQGLSLLSSQPTIIAKGTPAPSSSSRIASFCGLRAENHATSIKAAKVVADAAKNLTVVSSLEQEEEEDVPAVSRRSLLAATTTSAAALSLAGLFDGSAAIAEDTISSWEQVTLPVDAGVVLLDMAFVPEQPNRGTNFPSSQFPSIPSFFANAASPRVSVLVSFFRFGAF